MKHHNANRKFGRVRSQRTALMRSLALALIDHEKIQTTEAKAKELRPFIEKLITKGREQTLASKRLVISRLGGVSTGLAKKLIDDISLRYSERAGGYTRITKVAPRAGDASSMAVIEFV